MQAQRGLAHTRRVLAAAGHLIDKPPFGRWARDAPGKRLAAVKARLVLARRCQSSIGPARALSRLFKAAVYFRLPLRQ